MVEEAPVQKQTEGLRKDVKEKETKDMADLLKQIATRDKLERDYKEDLLNVVFQTSTETKRTIQARRPTQEEMISILRLSTETTLYENRMDEKAIKRMLEIYDQLPKIAAKLTVDSTLNEDFWKNKISFISLQSFITELIQANQSGPVTDEEMKNFR